MFIPMDEEEEVDSRILQGVDGTGMGPTRGAKPGSEEPGTEFKRLSTMTYSMLKEVEDGFSTRHNKGSKKIGGFSCRLSQVQGNSNQKWSNSSGEGTSKAIKSFREAISFENDVLDEDEGRADLDDEGEPRQAFEELEKGDINLNKHRGQSRRADYENVKGIMKASKFKNYVRDPNDNESKMSQITADSFLPQSFWEEELPTKSELIRKWESEMSNVIESKSSDHESGKIVTFLDKDLLSRSHFHTK